MQKFYNDIEKINSLIKKYDNQKSELYNFDDIDNIAYLEGFLSSMGMRVDDDSIYAIASRVINLRDESLSQVLKKQNFSSEEIKRIRLEAYRFTRSYYMKRFNSFIDEIDTKELLSPFYREIFRGVHNVGRAMNHLHIEWYSHIIDNINESLLDELGSDKLVLEYLEKNSLSSEADRSYSAIVRIDN